MFNSLLLFAATTTVNLFSLAVKSVVDFVLLSSLGVLIELFKSIITVSFCSIGFSTLSVKLNDVRSVFVSDSSILSWLKLIAVFTLLSVNASAITPTGVTIYCKSNTSPRIIEATFFLLSIMSSLLSF